VEGKKESYSALATSLEKQNIKKYGAKLTATSYETI
jgi:hypothetical protein